MNNNLVWIDLEMTGLDPTEHRIIEIATIVTDANLKVIAEGPNLVIHQPEIVLAKMNPWCVRQHGESGLTQRVRDSVISESEAEHLTLEFLTKHVPANHSPICGNSVSQDRRFLYAYMPKLERFFHYRTLDVSTIKELAKRWSPQILADLKKDSSHLALDDIRDSIAELQHYRNLFFNLPD